MFNFVILRFNSFSQFKPTYPMPNLLKISLITIAGLLLVYVGISIISLLAEPSQNSNLYETHDGTAVVITGAAARIVQEVALLEQLQQAGWLKNVCFISGASSGALNTVMLNAILTHKFSWQRYRQLLFGLKSDDVFSREGNSLPFDTNPLKNLLTSVICDSLGYDSIGNLPLASSISVTDLEFIPLSLKTSRLSNRKINQESKPGLNLVDVLMASTAIPVLFPSVRLRPSPTIPSANFIDGGVSEDHIPYRAVLQFEKYRKMNVDTLIIVSRKCDTKLQIDTEMRQLGVKEKDRILLEKAGIRLENLAKDGFIKQMKELKKFYPDLAAHTYVYIPDFQQNFRMMDFGRMEEQYDITAKWAESHSPVPLDEYLTSVDNQ